MHLLPHKSWNVWKKDNVEKVNKDEEEHRQEEEKKRKRQLDIEREKRYTSLKDRAKKAKIDEENASFIQQETVSVNIPANSENSAQQENGENEAEEEKPAAEKPKDTFGAFASNLPAPSSRNSFKPKVPETDEEKLKRIQKKKEQEDPLNVMNKFLNEKKKVEENKKQEKKKEKVKKSIEDLRKERLEREASERQKVQNILNPSKKETSRPTGYNSGYNKALAREKEFRV